MTLTARYVRRPRKSYDCDWCERPMSGAHIYLYGMADIGQEPFALRLHVGCVHGGRDQKVREVLARVESEAA